MDEAGSTTSTRESRRSSRATPEAVQPTTYSCIFEGCNKTFNRTAALMQHVHQFHFKEETSLRPEAVVQTLARPASTHTSTHTSSQGSNSMVIVSSTGTFSTSNPGLASVGSTPNISSTAHRRASKKRHRHKPKRESTPTSSETDERSAIPSKQVKRARLEDQFVHQMERDQETFFQAERIVDLANRHQVWTADKLALRLVGQVIARRKIQAPQPTPSATTNGVHSSTVDVTPNTSLPAESQSNETNSSLAALNETTNSTTKPGNSANTNDSYSANGYTSKINAPSVLTSSEDMDISFSTSAAVDTIAPTDSIASCSADLTEKSMQVPSSLHPPSTNSDDLQVQTNLSIDSSLVVSEIPPVSNGSEKQLARETEIVETVSDATPMVTQVLIRWYPENICDDEWQNVEDVNSDTPLVKTVNIAHVQKEQLWDVILQRSSPHPIWSKSSVIGKNTSVPIEQTNVNSAIPTVSLREQQPKLVDVKAVMLGRNHLAVLKTLYERQHITLERKLAIKDIILNEFDSPLYAPIIAALERCHTNKFYRGCAEALDELFWTYDLAIGHDMLQLLLADSKSRPLQDSKFPLNFTIIQTRLEQRHYRQLREFVVDVNKAFDDIIARLTGRERGFKADCAALREKFRDMIELVSY